MTRREFLGSMPLGAVAVPKPDFERIDTHTHIHRRIPALLAAMEESGWKALSICDSREMGDEPSTLPVMINGTRDAAEASNGRLAWATTFDARGFENTEFSGRTIAALRRDFAQGALGVKIWKNIGMGIRSKAGEYVLPDHSAFTPIFAAIQRADKTLLAHLADPDNSWQPLDTSKPESGYLKNHPEWLMYGRPGAPSKEAILAARDRILSRHPKLRVIGCHLGSSEEDLPAVARRLDAYPNFAVDLAARVRFLMRDDPAKVRQFLEKYADRILYGTDFQPGASKDEDAVKSFFSTHELEWSYLATGSQIDFRGRKIPGLALPGAVLRKIFCDNAKRWIPGIG